jgi:NAD(P)-dependent dehydrogenase (short-subunit alcohol dehydrogenase family)
MEWTLVTGAGQGLGSAICLELAKRGYPLVIHYRTNREKAEEVQRQCLTFGVKAELISGDFSSYQQTSEFLKEYRARFGSTKNLINNVGNYLVKPLLDTPMADWNDLYQTNLLSPVQIMQELVPSIKNLRGSIVNIGVVGIQAVPADKYAPAYTSTKLALWMITKSLAKELASQGVRVNMVSPGYLENAVDLPQDISSLPQQKTVSLEEAALVVAFVLDEKNSSITGQNIEIAGGVRL